MTKRFKREETEEKEEGPRGRITSTRGKVKKQKETLNGK